MVPLEQLKYLFTEVKPNVVDAAIYKNPAKWRQRNGRRRARRKASLSPHGKGEEDNYPSGSGEMMAGGYYRRSLEEIHRDAQRSHHARLTRPFFRPKQRAEDDGDIPPLEPELQDGFAPSTSSRKADEKQRDLREKAEEQHRQQREARKQEAAERQRRLEIEEKVKLLRWKQEYELKESARRRMEELRRQEEKDKPRKEELLEVKRKQLERQKERQARLEREEAERLKSQAEDDVRRAQIEERRRLETEERRRLDAEARQRAEEARRAREEQRRLLESQRQFAEASNGSKQEATLPDSLLQRTKPSEPQPINFKEPPQFHTQVTLLGPQGHGKSTLLGALLRVSGAWTDRQFSKFIKEQLDCEELRREEGSRTAFASLSLLDVPGNRKSLPQVVQAAAESDITLLVVSAKGKELEGSLREAGSSVSVLQEQLRISYGLGSRSLVIAVTKMSDAKWSQERFETIQALLAPMVEQTGFRKENVSFAPVDGSACDVEGRNSPWHAMPNLIDCLDAAARSISQKVTTMQCNSPSQNGSLQAVVLESSKGTNGQVLVRARLEALPTKGSASLNGLTLVSSPNPPVTFLLDGISSVCTAVNDGSTLGPLQVAELELSINSSDSFLSGGNASSCLGRGTMLTDASPVPTAYKLKASLDILEMPRPLTAGFKSIVHIHVATVEAEILKIIDATDLSTGEFYDKPKVVRPGQRITVLFQLSKEVCIPEHYVQDELMNRMHLLLMRFEDTTIGSGQVLDMIRDGQ